MTDNMPSQVLELLIARSYLGVEVRTARYRDESGLLGARSAFEAGAAKMAKRYRSMVLSACVVASMR